jgi:hypothetical protein
LLPRRCPLCGNDTIIGHGRRRKQAHDQQHDWIWIPAVDACLAEKHSRSSQYGRRLMAITAFDAGKKHLSRVVGQAAGNNRFPVSKIQTGYQTLPQ